MRKITAECTIGGLLHDVGKVTYRAGLEAGKHGEGGARWLSSVFGRTEDFGAVLDCVRCHHKAQLRGAKLAPGSPAYIVYIADNIAAGADRREGLDEEGTDGAPYDRFLPLSPVFNILNGNEARGVYAPERLSPQAVYPAVAGCAEAPDYLRIAAELGSELRKFLTPGGEYVNSLLGLMEVLLSYVPSSTARAQLADISLYDHCKVTAAAAACIAEFLAERGVSDYKQELFDNEAAFMDKRAFLVFSCDFSGIQNFIYTVESKGALKALRSRSFALELFMEHVVDEILDGCGLSRANLIYSGGGHAYMLLPNTAAAKDFLRAAQKRVNRWLMDNFGAALYLAFAWRECSAHELQNVPAEKAPYPQIFRDLSAELSRVKLSRYDAEALRALNSRGYDAGRECRVCGTSDDLTNDGLCRWCRRFVDISNDALRRDVIIAVVKQKPNGERHFIELPDVSGDGARYAVFTNIDGARGYAASDFGVRTYSKNRPHTGLNYSTNLYMGDYVSEKETALLAEKSEGIRRVAVCRADVDNLGHAFIEGFVRKGAESAGERYRYQTLSRTAAFSRQMSMFFKYHINSILAREDKAVKPLELSGGGEGGRNLLIVYSGGDDVFIVGGWDDVVGAACDIEAAFSKYTEGALSISAGVGIFGEKFPIYRAAALTGELEEASKSIEGKGCVTLFDTTGHTYRWSKFREGVLPKVRALAQYIDGGDNFRGKAFLYRLLSLARRAGTDRLDIARCAYLLARAEPKEKQAKEKYARFSANVMQWIMDRNERAEFITAAYLYVYLIRQRSEEPNDV